MPHKKLRPKFTFTEERINRLKQVAPEAFADGKINWETLKEALGEFLEEEVPDTEHFGLFWPGKREARRLAAMPGKGTLIPCPGEGLDEETTGNIFIEGENLEVLKHLQKSYAGRIKMIYIDPPYNTGNDFVYEDDFKEPLEEYLRRTGQVDEEGRPWSTNSRADGRFHSKWLSMMYPRLRLARNLLRDDGVIFVSIDDNEVHNLRQLMNEVFGEENFVGIFVWQSKKGGGSDSGKLVNDQEYVICYVKSDSSNAISRIEIQAEELDKNDEKGSYRRGRELNKWGSNSRREDRPTMFFPIPGPNDEDVLPIRNDGAEGCWRWGKKKMYQIVERGDVEYVQRQDGTYIVYEKIRSTDPRSKPFRTWLTNVGITADGSKKVKILFDGLKIFDFAKPIELIKHLIDIGTSDDNDIILDFFSGSATTTHALLEQNIQDDINRQYISIQLPEECPASSEAAKAGYRTIADIAKERIRRATKKIREENPDKTDFDLGFKVFKLTRSNFREWEDYSGADAAQLEAQFSEFTTPLVESWQPEQLLTEIMLQEGFPLDSVMETLGGFIHNKVWRVSSAVCAHLLIVCLDEKIAKDTLDRVVLREGDIFICLDAALTDQEKMRLADLGMLKTI